MGINILSDSFHLYYSELQLKYQHKFDKNSLILKKLFIYFDRNIIISSIKEMGCGFTRDLQVLNNLLTNQNAPKIHFIGIGGSGMFPLAEILFAKGYTLSGSDNNPSDTVERVKAMGIPVIMGHHPENVRGCGLVVYTAAVFENNPELVAARQAGIPTIGRAELLSIVVNSFEGAIGVCGTHGKTTSTAMLTEILMDCGADPSAVIGGKLTSIGGSGRVGGSRYMVCEADEFRDTFLNIRPETAVILNVQEDHLEYFQNLDTIIASFARFAGQTRKTVVVNADDSGAKRAVEGCKTPVIRVGTTEDCDFQAVGISQEGPFARYDLLKHGVKLGRVDLSVPGIHQVHNSLCVLAAADSIGLPMDRAIAAAGRFGGAGRRFEFLGNAGGVTLADDYAHNPKELEVTLRTAGQMGFKRIIAVFQPVTYSRTALMLDEFAEALALADKVVLTEIMGAREINTYGISSADLAAKIPGAEWFAEFGQAADCAVSYAKEGDLILTLGCGDIYKAARMILEKLKNK